MLRKQISQLIFTTATMSWQAIKEWKHLLFYTFLVFLAFVGFIPLSFILKLIGEIVWIIKSIFVDYPIIPACGVVVLGIILWRYDRIPKDNN